MLTDIMILLFVVLCSAVFQSYGQFTIPEVTLEAYTPKGFRASIPALSGIHMFAFHGNVNKEITQVDPGDYHQDFTSPTDTNLWSYFNPDLALNIGDEVNYWVFIQHDKMGYRKDNLKWKVTELLKLNDTKCEKSITVVNGKTIVCKNSIIFQDDFNQQEIDTKKWTIEQYIATHKSLDYEFVSYQNKPEICFINRNKLHIKPSPANFEKEVNGELDLRGRCTRDSEEECYAKQQIFLILPPVTSGRLVSNFKFKYGKIEIVAKLPSGDWIYPQLYLEQSTDPRRKLWIAYARGNNKLLANNGEDIGGTLLFGGPVLDPEEPSRSQYLKTKRENKPFSAEMHTYTVIWEPTQILLLVDGTQYGRLAGNVMNEIKALDMDMMHIVLGVGVGGVNDFPDDYRSENSIKPWKNKENKQVKKFFDARSSWIGSWKLTTQNRALQVDSVKVWAL